MSLRNIPLLFIPFLIYNVMALSFGDPANPAQIFADAAFAPIPMPSGGSWTISFGDMLLGLTLILLALEVIKATFVRRGSGIADQALSLILLVLFIIQFLLDDNAATSIFFLMALAQGIDVIAGAIIGIQTARRDFGFGGTE